MLRLGNFSPLAECFTSLCPSLPEIFSIFLFKCSPIAPHLVRHLSPISCVLSLFLCVRLSLSASLWRRGMCVLQILCQWDVGRVQTGLGYSMWISFCAQVRLDHHTGKDSLFILHPTALLHSIPGIHHTSIFAPRSFRFIGFVLWYWFSEQSELTPAIKSTFEPLSNVCSWLSFSCAVLWSRDARPLPQSAAPVVTCSSSALQVFDAPPHCFCPCLPNMTGIWASPTWW